MTSKIELKTINELHDMKFYIPSYQRGYRWTEQQIKDLLNDINEFESKDGSWYCLQPLVVKQQDSESEILEEIKGAATLQTVRDLLQGKWAVIDGQQRLTTIYLILKLLGKNNFRLEYQRENYIEKCDLAVDIQLDNIEIYYLTTAKKIIGEWFDGKTGDFKNTFTQKCLYCTKFIWYDVGDLDEEQEHLMFSNLNSGKIALTNAELIKALFLNRVNILKGSEREVRQRAIAEEFDQIERTIRQDDFWYFIAGNEEKPSSYINILFDLMLDSDSDERRRYPKEEPFSTFFYFNERFKKDTDLWEKVQTYFHVLEGWFSDSELYNLIGYLRAVKGNTALSDLYKIFEGSGTLSKFRQELKKKCRDSIVSEDEDSMNLRYDMHRDKVFNLLLLFNIATLNANPKEKNRFSFASLHQDEWDVEHISPQNPKDNNELEKVINESETPQAVFKELKEALRENDNDRIDVEKKKYFASGDALMSLQNLTLLNSHDNRGIGNGFFFEKRNKLKENFQKGSFIPRCSINVFMKFYSDNPTQMDFWDTQDQESYKVAIKETIDKFFKEA